MDFSNVLNKSNPHQRTIIHLDMDCYYAQVEEIRDPTLRTQPVGIQQGNMVVTSNYVAREFGIRKLSSVAEAKRLCPNLVLINGEDITPYRLMSNRIFETLLTFTPTVEKLCLDENFLDVTSIVEKREEERMGDAATVVGHIFPNDNCSLNECDCGCASRLSIGTQIAKEIRDELFDKLSITCCAGISYNKLLAKLVGAQNKPNQQTVLVSSRSEEFMRTLNDLHRVTGIGQKTETLLMESGIRNIAELQSCDMDCLRKKFGFETATKLKNLACGRDTGAVRPSGKPKTIGLEDSCRPISVRTEVEERFRMLLMRLNEKVAEDGRIPIAIKIMLRKYDTQKKTSHRESKQANILPSLFKGMACNDTVNGNYKVTLADGAHEKLLKIIMRLFERIIDLSKPFNITLIGLAFSKFQQRKVGSSSIANFLIKKTDLEVQSITSLTNTSVVATSESPTPSVSSTNSDDAFRSSPTTFQPSDQFYRRRTMAASPIPMFVDNGSESAATNSDFSDFSETEVEPSPKKSRIGRLLMAKRRCLSGTSIQSGDAMDVASPSKLRVCDLRLNSRDSEKDVPNCSNSNVLVATVSNASTTTTLTIATNSFGGSRMRNVRPPFTLLGRIDKQISKQAATCKISPLASPMDEYCNDEASAIMACAEAHTPISSSSNTMHSTRDDCATQTPAFTTTKITGNLANIPCPSGVDPQVFNELPLDVQNELIASWRSSLAAAAAAVNGTTDTNQTPRSTANTAKGAAPNTNGAQKNTLYRYFLRNK